MSIKTTQHLAVAGIRRGNIQIAPGILTSVTVNPDKSFITIGEQFWTAMLAYGPTPEEGILQVLCSGYTLWPNGLSWQGFLEIPQNIYLILEGVSQTALTHDSTVTDSRVVLNVNGSLTQFLMKVNAVKP